MGHTPPVSFVCEWAHPWNPAPFVVYGAMGRDWWPTAGRLPPPRSSNLPFHQNTHASRPLLRRGRHTGRKGAGPLVRGAFDGRHGHRGVILERIHGGAFEFVEGVGSSWAARATTRSGRAWGYWCWWSTARQRRRPLRRPACWRMP
jgi:hypothetical protein